MTPKDAFDFKVLVIYLPNTHVELEIHLSLPDNNVQNSTSCLNHYLQPGVALLMNMHEPGEGEERSAQPVSRRSLRWFSSMFWAEAPSAKPSVCLSTPSSSGLLGTPALRG